MKTMSEVKNTLVLDSAKEDISELKDSNKNHQKMYQKEKKQK